MGDIPAKLMEAESLKGGMVRFRIDGKVCLVSGEPAGEHCGGDLLCRAGNMIASGS